MQISGVFAMPVPVTKSEHPLVQDTVPAIKARYYNGANGDGHIYTFARIYFWERRLALNTCCFQRTPPANSRVAFALAGQNNCIYITLPPKEAGAPSVSIGAAQSFHSPLQPFGTPLPSPAPLYFAGNDEQGWYWGANVVLEEDLVGKTGLDVAPGNVFGGAVFQFTIGQSAYASSAPFASNGNTPSSNFTQFTIVSY